MAPLDRLFAVGACAAVALMLVGCADDRADQAASASGPASASTTVDQKSVAQQRAEMADYFGVEAPPEVDVIRLVTPEEFDSLLPDCLAGQGFDEATTSTGFPVEQLPAFNLAQYVCYAKYPIDPAYTGEWTDRQIGIQYDWVVSHVIPCLREHGWQVSDPPSRDVFISTWDTQPFFPFEQLPNGISDADWSALEEACPQSPPSDVLWN